MSSSPAFSLSCLQENELLDNGVSLFLSPNDELLWIIKEQSDVLDDGVLLREKEGRKTAKRVV